jgi:hypothetical protein
MSGVARIAAADAFERGSLHQGMFGDPANASPPSRFLSLVPDTLLVTLPRLSRLERLFFRVATPSPSAGSGQRTASVSPNSGMSVPSGACHYRRPTEKPHCLPLEREAAQSKCQTNPAIIEPISGLFYPSPLRQRCSPSAEPSWPLRCGSFIGFSDEVGCRISHDENLVAAS